MRLVAGLSALILTSAGCSSIPGGAGADHAAHHPTPSNTSAPAGYDQQMTSMQDMHRKMAAAKTPEDRATLMKEHMKTMQDGMAMMGQMRGMPRGGSGMGMGSQGAAGSAPLDADVMKRRIDMMDMMMQMMMDREGMKAPAAR